MTRRISIVAAIFLLLPIVFLSACMPSSAPSRTFQDLIENKIQHARERSYGEFTGGVVIYFIERNGREFFVATYLDSDGGMGNGFIVVQASIRGLAVGDIVQIAGTVKEATGKTKENERITVYYLDSNGGNSVKTGRADAGGQNFEELVRIVSEEISREEINDWFFNPLNPFSPFSPINPLNPASPLFDD